MSEISYVNEVKVRKCAVCGALKGEANHFQRIGVVRADGIQAVVVGSALERVLEVAGEQLASELEVYDVCGQQHFHQKLDEFLGMRGNAPSDVQASVAIARDAAREVQELER